MTQFDTILQFRAYTTRAGYRQLDEALRMHNTVVKMIDFGRKTAVSHS